MNFPFYIARRYFFSRKSTNVINLISFIAVIGVAFGTAALIVVLSVFNGFVWMSKTMLNSFNPDLKIVSAHGKYFSIDSVKRILDKYPGQIQAYSFTLEENALFEYEGRQTIGIVKGVDQNFIKVTDLSSKFYSGEYQLYYKGKRPMAMVGIGISDALGVELNFLGILKIWLPRPDSKISLDITQMFNRCSIFVSGVFSINQDIDNKYVIVPLSFLQENLNLAPNIATAAEIKLTETANVQKTEKVLAEALGNNFIVRNQFEQEEMYYKIVKSEKLAVIVILAFIIIIASFNIIGTLSMLIIEKKDDIETLRYLGANKTTISQIFTIEGSLIAGIGLLTGIILGISLVLIQHKFGIIKFPTNDVWATPYVVILKFQDILITTIIVSIIGFFAARLPVRYFVNKYFSQ